MAEKKYSGAPFGTQTARFDVSGVHPQNKLPGTYTEVPYCRKATSKEKLLLGPGTYNTDTNSSTHRQEVGGANWERALQLSRLSAIPHHLFRREWEGRRRREALLGPGRYQLWDFVEEGKRRPGSRKGVCGSRGPRLAKENKYIASLPGPGCYGEGGIPSSALERKSRQSPGTVELLDRGGVELRPLPMTAGCDLGPGQYRQVPPLEQLLAKKTSSRGGYDLFTGERSPPSKLQIQNRHLGPGTYDLRPFTADLNDGHHRRHGCVGSVAQYPTTPTERVYCTTLSQWPRRREDPGPGHYTKQQVRVCSAPPTPRVCGFSSSVTRNTQTSHGQGMKSGVGPGQYDVSRWQLSQNCDGHCSIFSSHTPRLPPTPYSSRELLLNERVHPRGQPYPVSQELLG